MTEAAGALARAVLGPQWRRAHTLAEAGRRVREAEAAHGLGPGDLPRLLGHVILLLKDVAGDSRVPRRDKLLAGLAAVYVASPVDLVPDAAGLLGQIDDVGVALYAVRRLLAAAGPDVIRERWRGSDEGLAAVLAFAGVRT